MSGGGRKVAAKIINLSGRGVSLAVDETIAMGEAVRIDLDDSLLLGEICYCRPESGSFVIGIEMSNVIPAMTDLRKLVAAIMQESPVRQEATRVSDVRMTA